MPHGEPSIWDDSLTLDEWEAKLHAWRRGRLTAAASPKARAPSPGHPVRSAMRNPDMVARAEGMDQARRDALAVIAICNEYGRPDLIGQVVGMTPAAARQYLIDRMWGDGFAKARAIPAWQPR